MTEETVLQHRVREVEKRADRLSDRIHRTEELAGDHEEQINGKRGLYVAVDELTNEIKSLRRAIAGVGCGIIVASVTFALNLLKHV